MIGKLIFFKPLRFNNILKILLLFFILKVILMKGIKAFWSESCTSVKTLEK